MIDFDNSPRSQGQIDSLENLFYFLQTACKIAGPGDIKAREQSCIMNEQSETSVSRNGIVL